MTKKKIKRTREKWNQPTKMKQKLKKAIRVVTTAVRLMNTNVFSSFLHWF